MYDKRFGRWLSPDPYNQFASPYIGMGNNPVSFGDPNGGMAASMAWRLGGMVVGGIAGGLIDKDNPWRGAAIGMAAGYAAGYGLSKVNLSGFKLPNLELPSLGPGALNVVSSATRALIQSSPGEGSDQFHFFWGEGRQSKAYNFMVDMQARDGVEMSAMMVKTKTQTGIIVQPWDGNTAHSAPGAYKGVVPDDGYRRMVLKGQEYSILAHIHTHPPGGNYEGPSGPGNAYGGGSGDLGVHNLTGWKMFVIGPTEVSLLNPNYPTKRTTWTDHNYNVHTGNRHKIGSTTDLLNGKLSLFDR
jgi:hypothetical protein